MFCLFVFINFGDQTKNLAGALLKLNPTFQLFYAMATSHFRLQICFGKLKNLKHFWHICKKKFD